MQVCEALAKDAGVSVDEVFGTIERLQVRAARAHKGRRARPVAPHVA